MGLALGLADGLDVGAAVGETVSSQLKLDWSVPQPRTHLYASLHSHRHGLSPALSALTLTHLPPVTLSQPCAPLSQACLVGDALGRVVGVAEGLGVGEDVGRAVGAALGLDVGLSVGATAQAFHKREGV